MINGTYKIEKWYLYNHFVKTFEQLSLSYIMFLVSLFLFLSLLFLANKKREKEGCHKNCHQMVVQISLLYKIIITHTLHSKEIIIVLKESKNQCIHKKYHELSNYRGILVPICNGIKVQEKIETVASCIVSKVSMKCSAWVQLFIFKWSCLLKQVSNNRSFSLLL